MRRRSARLPAQPTSLVHRADELASIHTCLAGGDARLLTLTGPAGVGKTRTALEVAARLADLSDVFPDGVVFVDLSPVRDPAFVVNSLADALGVQERGGQSLVERLQELLGDRRMLLVLDNFEQVLPASTDLAALLSACPHLTMLVTSRAPLQLRWERTLRIPPLPVPDLAAPLPPLEELLAIPSVALFVQRARAHRADFDVTEQQAPLLARLTAQLDGLPLALELAAALTATLSLPVIVNRMAERLQLLRWEARDAPERQHSLAAAVGWSYDLLSRPKQQLFRCLGVFEGPVSLSAVLAVWGAVHALEDGDGCAPTLYWLISLAEQSLIMPGRPAEPAWQTEASDAADESDEADPAFGMLETVRGYAAERLAAAGECEAARRAHAAHFQALAEQADPQLRGRDQRRWFLRLERERHNLRAALRWLLDQPTPEDRAAGLRMAGALGYFWQLRGYHAEGRRWLDEALAVAPAGESGADADTDVRIRALLPAGTLLAFGGEVDRAQLLLGEALALARQRQDAASTVRALIHLGICPGWVGATPALPLLRRALGLARKLDNPYYVALALFYLGMALQAEGDAAEAASHYLEALDLFDAMGNAHILAGTHFALGRILAQQGDLPNAVRHTQAGLAASLTLQDRWLVTQGASTAVVVLGDRVGPADRARLLGAADALRQANGSARVVWELASGDPASPRLGDQAALGEWEANYRLGRSLHPRDVAALASRLLIEVAENAPAVTPFTYAATTSAAGRNPTGFLTDRERAVLELVAQGFTSKAIGQQLFISSRTVSQHLTSIFNKLSVNTRAQAVAVGTHRGLI
jgi:non-specific serine/threonine protein kinase